MSEHSVPVDVDSLAALGWAFRVLHRNNIDIPTAIGAAASVGIEEGLRRDEMVVRYAAYLESRERAAVGSGSAAQPKDASEK